MAVTPGGRFIFRLIPGLYPNAAPFVNPSHLPISAATLDFRIFHIVNPALDSRRLAVRSFIRIGICLLAFGACVSGWSFVFYPVGNNPLRWNVDSGVAHANVVNPVTKAVRYYIASDAYSASAEKREAEIAAVRACFDQWQSISGSRLKFEFAGLVSPQGLDVREDNTNVVYWAKTSTRVANGQMNISGLPAWTSVNFAADGSILEADIVLNGLQFTWFTDFNDTANQAQFIESVALHEIGHFVGLDHAVAGGATIFAGGNGITAQAGLSADEIAAMRFLYPIVNPSSAAIKGTVRLNGLGILGAVVLAEDENGNVAGATATRADGTYDLPGLNPGTYSVRVTPLDPAGTGNEKLIRGSDIAFEYQDAVTAFAATTNRPVTLSGPLHTVILDLNVSAGPPFRITSISKPTTIPGLVSVVRHAVTLVQGQENQFLAVSGPNLPSDATLSVTGDGLTVGPTTFLQDRIVPGIHSLVVNVSVTSNATPGLRTFVVTRGLEIAYANGFLEIVPPVPDYNFDGLDDRFQRAFWNPWTRAESAPAADPDGDAFSNAFEFRTGTNPTNAASYQLSVEVSRLASTTTISWDSDPGKRYQLYSRASLSAGSWQAQGRPLSATGNRMTLSDSQNEQARFYRLELQP